MLPELDKDSRMPEPRRSHCHMEGVDNFHNQWKGVEVLARVEFWVMPDGRTRHPHLTSIVPVEAKDLYESWLRSNALRARYTPTVADSGPVRCSFVEDVTSGTDIASTYGLGRAIDLTRRAADNGDSAAQASYGLMSIGQGRSYTQANPTEWFLMAAQAGDPVGQRELGRSLLDGLGCHADEHKALFWLERAAAAGDADATVMLAVRTLGDATDPQRHEHAKALLEEVARPPNDDAMLTLAALLATTPQEDIRDPKRSLQLLDAIFSRVNDDPMTFEIRAAARAGSGDFASAIDDQTKALAMAVKLKWSTAAEQQRLAAYKAQKPWFGELEGF
jgi:hypothetical protein